MHGRLRNARHRLNCLQNQVFEQDVAGRAVYRGEEGEYVTSSKEMPILRQALVGISDNLAQHCREIPTAFDRQLSLTKRAIHRLSRLESTLAS